MRTEARAGLERRYFGGQDVLLPDAGATWGEHVELVERLARLAEAIPAAEPHPRRPKGAGTPTIRDRVATLAGRLADDARVKAYEILGERDRAVTIMERRLGTKTGALRGDP